jgi:hypothetical protein
MPIFADNLERLPLLEEIAALQLRDASGEICGLIENKPGSQGSLRVYGYLAEKWGGIGPEAAREGLDLYAEHTEDARSHPRKHPNIDRLFRIIEQGAVYEVTALPR